MYYRKLRGAQAVADKCGVGDVYRTLGYRIHIDDMPQVELMLGLTKSGIELLFEYEGEQAQINDLFDLYDPDTM